MKNYSIILFFCLFSLKIAAQEQDSYEYSVSSINSLESKSVSADFLLKFYKGGYIDSASKWEAIYKLNDKNYVGFFSLNRADVSVPCKKDFSLYFSIVHQNLLGFGFTRNFFQLVFTGNNSLLGTNVMLNPTVLQRYNFTETFAGVKYKLKENLYINAAIGPAFIYSHNNLNFSKSSFYTSPTADSLSLFFNGSYVSSGSSAFIKGVGFGSEIGMSGISNNIKWKISASNLGCAWLNRKAINSVRDTLMYFTGFEVAELSNFSNVVDEQVDDFEKTFDFKSDTAKTSMTLPFLISGECAFQTGKIESFLSFNYYRMKGFIPFIQYYPFYALNDNWKISLPLKYGGFGPFNAGVGFECKIIKKISVLAEFPSLLSFARTKDNTSINACFKIVYKN